MVGLAKYLGGQCQPGATPLKKGGKVKNCKEGGAVKHDDAKQDKKIVIAELKKRGLKCGGKVKK
jgi:hypothetical protein